uniref:Uncharacterized protein n=1 Tax=Rhabditophanes sp. KR3021 TaxID=114890 RepID=A0AC35TT04_9BILA
MFGANGNNLWLSRFPKENNRGDNSEEDKNIMNRFISEACDDLMKNVFKVGSHDTLSITEINKFILERFGNEQVRAINISNQLEFEHFEIYKYVDVIRSKRINDTCYKDFPAESSRGARLDRPTNDLSKPKNIQVPKIVQSHNPRRGFYCDETVKNRYYTLI